MEKQKNKAKQMPNRRKPLLKFFLIGGGIFVLIIVVLIIVGPMRWGDGQIHQTSLPDELRSTAETVFATVPLDVSMRLTDDVSIRLDTTGFGANTICFDAGYVPIEPNYPRHSQVFVNGDRIRGIINHTPFITLSGSEAGINLCIHGNLEPGLHLLEFHLRDSFWGDPIAIQQWAIEIE